MEQHDDKVHEEKREEQDRDRGPVDIVQMQYLYHPGREGASGLPILVYRIRLEERPLGNEESQDEEDKQHGDDERRRLRAPEAGINILQLHGYPDGSAGPSVFLTWHSAARGELQHAADHRGCHTSGAAWRARPGPAH